MWELLSLNDKAGPGTVAHTYNFSTLGGQVGRSLEPRSLRPAWAMWQNPACTKNTKISQAWWWVPIIPATQEAEAEESLEPMRWRLQWAEIAPLHHSCLGRRTRLCLPKKNNHKTSKADFCHCQVTLLITNHGRTRTNEIRSKEFVACFLCLWPSAPCIPANALPMANLWRP